MVLRLSNIVDFLSVLKSETQTKSAQGVLFWGLKGLYHLYHSCAWFPSWLDLLDNVLIDTVSIKNKPLFLRDCAILLQRQQQKNIAVVSCINIFCNITCSILLGIPTSRGRYTFTEFLHCDPCLFHYQCVTGLALSSSVVSQVISAHLKRQLISICVISCFVPLFLMKVEGCLYHLTFVWAR